MNAKEKEELDLLAKLEEQNRALLADAKAVPSLNTRRREGSISSSLSTESSTDGLKLDPSSGASNQLKFGGGPTITLPSMIAWGSIGISPSIPLREQWAHVVNNWDHFVKKRSFVSDLIRKGLPDEFRPVVWQLFTGAYDSPSRKLYDSYLEVQSPVEKAIRRDIARTFPKHDLFKDANGNGQESLFRVIKAYSVHDREVGYCQGSGFIAGLLLMQLPELDAFTVLVQLMNGYHLREMYKPAMVELGVCMYQLERLLSEYQPDLYTHFVTHSFAPSLYASAWFLTLFSTILPIKMATRVMDLYIAEGISFTFRLALALLKFSADKLLNADMESMVAYLQNEGPVQWERHANTIFESANTFKLNGKKMKKLEKEYLQMRSQEREDQIELRRLRTESGLLLQRVARLEEECGVMADRLVQSQLIRAQEAETILALRCELSILRRTYGVSAAATKDSSETCSSEIANGKESGVGNGSMGSLNHCSPASSESTDMMLTTYKANTSVNASESEELNGRDADEVLCTFVNGAHPTVDQSTVSVTELDLDSVNEDNDALTKSVELIPVSQMNGWSQSLVCHKHSSNHRGDTLVVTNFHRLQSDLTLCRAREADLKSSLLDLKTRYHELEEVKSDQVTRSSEQIAVLKDELFSVKRRETEALARLEDLRGRLAEVESLWQTHSTRCKNTGNDSKRTSLRIGSLGLPSSAESTQRLSDLVLETRYLDQIASLKQQLSESNVQREMADRRADRLDQRVTELLESRASADARERELRLELKQAVQMCAEIEAKRKADALWWRSREMELTAQLTERRQCQLQLECSYESLLARQSFNQMGRDPSVSYRGDSEQSNAIESPATAKRTFDTRDSPDGACALGGCLLAPSPLHTNGSSGNSTEAVNESDEAVTPNASTFESSASSPGRDSSDVLRKSLTAMWKDLPSTVMTDSIGPLEELCLVPDDPMITSIYVRTTNGSDC
ncbi:Ecotropic viral integration site 5 protein [Paragonimus heterotremus]|uniref:Ecotropic viral integration site 5 protein n=1 Tax=Paragonimus heterotremus TaxID=100268 RepID=A0A8J4SS66_9TREM|nr:Ecotropic viral integration site 5 protein [Paragonimus heterotremus]